MYSEALNSKCNLPNIGALIIAYTILGAPYNYNGPQNPILILKEGSYISLESLPRHSPRGKFSCCGPEALHNASPCTPPNKHEALHPFGMV